MLDHKFDLFMKSVAVAALCFAFRPFVMHERPPQPSHDETIYVGLIEDDRKELGHLGSKDFYPVNNRAITAAFMRDASGWRPAHKLNSKIRWTVAFNGKSLGEVESAPVASPQATSEKITGPSNVQSILTPADKIPTVGKPEGKFNGNFETIIRRPLVVVSEPQFADPDHWTLRQLPSQVMSEVRSSFRRTFRHVRQCDASGEALKGDWKVPDSEIVITKSYGSNKSEFIVETKVLHNKCLFNVDGDDFQSLGGNQLFHATFNREAAFLGLQWELVDAGDYDADGKSEVIFYVAEGKDIDIETEGYVLFYDDFRHNVRFVWENH